ncbi:MAG: response regulator [Pseudomonadales bacterium]|nr:response regulator [Pseudomonadales bacterium]
MLIDQPIDSDHQKIAKILSWVATVVIVGTGIVRYFEYPESTLFVILRVIVVASVLTYGVGMQYVTTQLQFDKWSAFLLYIVNCWVLALVWQYAFQPEAAIGLLVVVFISQVLITNVFFNRIYAIGMLAIVAFGLWFAPEVSVSRMFLLILFPFCLLTNNLVTSKWIKDRDSLQENEQKLVESRTEAENAAMSRSQFMANMSHEVRTPLNGIIGTTSLLESTELNDEQKAMIDTVRESSELLLSLVNDILDFSKIDVTGINIAAIDTDIELTTSQCIDMLLPFAQQKELDLVLDVNPNAFSLVSCDANKLKQIIVNLLNNAIKFTESGEIKLQVDLQTSESNEAQLTCCISDTGIGITQGQLENIFEEFAQGDASSTRRYGGSGLGLAICKKLLEAMGGSIEVDSTLGSGTTFTFFIPVVPVIAPAQEWMKKDSLKNYKAAVVSQSESKRSIYLSYFRFWGLQAFSMVDDNSLLDWLNTVDDPDSLPDLLFIDLNVTSYSVRALSDKIEALYGARRPTIVLLSTNRKNNSREGNTTVLINPARPSMLHKVVTDAISENESNSDEVSEESNVDNPDLDSSNLRVLLAEDNPVNIKVACSMLDRLGYHHEVAVNGLEALVQVNVGNFDIVFMDLQMPEMDGLTATEKIRRLPINQPYIIALTANAYEKDRENCKKAGMDDFLAKPIRLNELKSVLQRVENSHLADGVSTEKPSLLPKNL